ncbi:ACT domain-containing protein [Clostridiales bacterium COT073_COT-073]|nr:ACT domain-containing protein [Clostridiales bacterium COT073_COT-073]
MKRAIITVVGKDSVGIIAGVCTYLAEKQINILDITQSIRDCFFNMMMIVDITPQMENLSDISEELVKLGEKLNVKIMLQLEDIFDSMHRI